MCPTQAGDRHGTGARALRREAARPDRRGRCQLYDLERDPEERLDVSRDPAYADDLKRLAEAITGWFEQTESPGVDARPTPDSRARDLLRRGGYLREGEEGR